MYRRRSNRTPKRGETPGCPCLCPSEMPSARSTDSANVQRRTAIGTSSNDHGASISTALSRERLVACEEPVEGKLWVGLIEVDVLQSSGTLSVHETKGRYDRFKTWNKSTNRR